MHGSYCGDRAGGGVESEPMACEVCQVVRRVIQTDDVFHGGLRDAPHRPETARWGYYLVTASLPLSSVEWPGKMQKL